MKCRQRLIDLFEAEGVPYRIHAHSPTYTAQEEAGAEHLPGRRVAKVVISLAEEQPVMIVLAADRHVDFQAASRAVGNDSLRLAREDEFETLFPDCDVGSMPPFGNLYGVPVYVDTELVQEPELTFLAGSHEDSVTIPTEAFERLARPTRAVLAAPGRR